MNKKLQGIFFGVVAAVCYGTNPLGALYLYQEGLNVNTVIFYRYLIAVACLVIMMIMKREPFGMTRKELGITALLGALFGISSLTLFGSFKFMDAGIASTILFVYPIMVAVIMAIFFKERTSWKTVLSITLALVGIGLLYKGDGNATLSGKGVTLVMLSSLTYAIYIVIVNQAKIAMSSVKLTFYVLIFATVIVAAYSFIGPAENHITMLHGTRQWGYAAMLGVVPTVISLVTMSISIRLVGSTPAAIMGALEPVTAVAIGVTIFGESLTGRLMIGIALILTAVILIIISSNNKEAKVETKR